MGEEVEVGRAVLIIRPSAHLDPLVIHDREHDHEIVLGDEATERSHEVDRFDSRGIGGRLAHAEHVQAGGNVELRLEALLDLLLGRGGAHEGAERGRALELVHLQVGLLDHEHGAHDLADLILEDLVLVGAAHELG